eukprot:6213665-Pleurochrysis_carterae.AAC.1
MSWPDPCAKRAAARVLGAFRSYHTEWSRAQDCLVPRTKLRCQSWHTATSANLAPPAAGACWSTLEHAGARWSLLEPAGACWSLLEPAGACWSLL